VIAGRAKTQTKTYIKTRQAGLKLPKEQQKVGKEWGFEGRVGTK